MHCQQELLPLLRRILTVAPADLCHRRNMLFGHVMQAWLQLPPPWGPDDDVSGRPVALVSAQGRQIQAENHHEARQALGFVFGLTQHRPKSDCQLPQMPSITGTRFFLHRC